MSEKRVIFHLTVVCDEAGAETLLSEISTFLTEHLGVGDWDVKDSEVIEEDVEEDEGGSRSPGPSRAEEDKHE